MFSKKFKLFSVELCERKITLITAERNPQRTTEGSNILAATYDLHFPKRKIKMPQ
jgi:hypothetical protein